MLVQWIKKGLFIGPVLGLLVYYFYSVNNLLEDIPIADDFFTFDWLNAFEKKENLIDQFTHLFAQANSHRLFTYFLAVLFDRSVFEIINFERLIWYAQPGLLIILLVLYYLVKEKSNSVPIMLSLSFLLIVPMFEISDWGMVAFASLVQYALVLVTLFLLTRTEKWAFPIALFTSILANFSFGNGMFVFPAGFIVLWLTPQRSRREFILWGITMVTGISLYFVGFDFHDGNSDFVFNLKDSLTFFCVFFAGIFSPLVKHDISKLAIIGAALLIYVCAIFVLKRKEFLANPVPLAMMAFVVLSGMAATAMRLKFGVDIAASPRYGLLCALFTAMVMIVSADLIKQRNLILAFLIAGSVFLYDQRRILNELQMQTMQFYQRDYMYYYQEERENMNCKPLKHTQVENLLTKANSYGVYYPPTVASLYPEIKKIEPPSFNQASVTEMFHAIDSFQNGKNIIAIKGWAFSKKWDNKMSRIVVILKNDNHLATFEAFRSLRLDVQQYYSKETHLNTDRIGFKFIMSKKLTSLPSGSYDVGLCFVVDGEVKEMAMTPYCVDI